jgi:cytochrome c551/c552
LHRRIKKLVEQYAISPAEERDTFQKYAAMIRANLNKDIIGMSYEEFAQAVAEAQWLEIKRAEIIFRGLNLLKNSQLLPPQRQLKKK